MKVVEGPCFEDLTIGQVFESPAVTLTSGAAAAHQLIVGDRLRMTLDHELGRRVTGDVRPRAHPAHVWDIAIGQSTVVTQNVRANLFYRGLAFHRLPFLGDTLSTRTEIVGLRRNKDRPERAPTGLAALRITTSDQFGRRVLDFWRCAMLPVRAADDPVSRHYLDDLDTIGADPDSEQLLASITGWDLDEFRPLPGAHSADIAVGDSWRIAGGDVVGSAPELARLTTNLARVHHDGSSSPDGRLVYGGHTIAVALAQACRALPNLVTVVGWHGCDHLAPVREGDTLHSDLVVEQIEAIRRGALVHLRSRVRVTSSTDEPVDVLDWRFIAVMA